VFNDDFEKKIDRFTRGIVRRKIAQLIGRAGFAKQDREDLEQELTLRVLQSLPSFDPAQAHRNVFTTTVVERFVDNILRHRGAEKRDYRRISSLNVMIDIEDEGSVELGETVSQRELHSRTGRHPRSNEELAQLAHDVADVMATLPNDLRDLVELLEIKTVSEAARAMGVPRTTLNESVRRLRRRFESAGLKDYL